jgi:hypothetical protein
MRILFALLIILTLQFIPARAAQAADYPTEAQAIQACLNYVGTGGWCKGPSTSNGRHYFEALRGCGRVGSEPWAKRLFASGQISSNCGSGTGLYSSVLLANVCARGINYDMSTCFPTQAECQAKPRLENQTYMGSTIVAKIAKDGCEYSPSGDSVSLCLGEPPFAENACMSPKNWKATGEKSGTSMSPPSTVTSLETCTAAGGGQTVCMKANGQLCATATTGRRLCWRPGETGEKVDQDVLQVRNAGSTPQTPQTPPPPGETFAASGSPVKQVACYGYFRDQGCGASPTAAGGPTTTIQNYKTANGTNAGGTKFDQGENADGSAGSSAGGAGGGGEGEGQGSASGGESCAAPPVCSGDPVGCAALAQQFLARCEANTRGDVTGADLDETAGLPETAGSLWGDADTSTLDEGGLLGVARTCPVPPTFTLGGATRTIDTSGMCDLGAIIAALVLLVAFAQSAWILGEH